jgi:peptidoglycan/LPS O-acetylase OafA/YrhL
LAFAALIGHTVSAPDSVLSRALSARWICWLGRRSYGFYLWHAPVLLVLLPRVHNYVAWVGSGLLLSLAATVVSWRLVETPFLRMKRRFERVGTGHDELAPEVAEGYQRTTASS